MNNGDDSKTGISQFALYTQPIHLLPSLVYKKSYIIYFEFEVVHITPLSSGYSHFHILNSSSEIPYDLAFNPDSGSFFIFLLYCRYSSWSIETTYASL